ncbi:MAG TPA: asparagine synthase (glutamine-hydrolyzing), partial [Burkholderiales bacterium]|nr:asparagine synthase (glutamine-hydrolyzing) [Burkholderiales bacterium]
LAFDGSIDNRDELRKALQVRSYEFRTGSDDELVLRAYQHWDKDVVTRLRGRFALALWDARKERLLLARDRFGEKPLYLADKDGVLYFASEPKALRAILPLVVDLEAVRDCLVHSYVPGPRTMFAGVRKLAPASLALWQFGKLRETRYWSLPDAQTIPGKAPADAVQGFLVRLDEAVALQAGEGCGVLLSGGLDSAVLLALASHRHPKIATFSLGCAGDKRSELPQAAQVAKHFATRHHELDAQPKDLVDGLPRLIALRDAPLALPSDLALHALLHEVAKSCKAVLGGDGSDEMLGGYRRYVAAKFWPNAALRSREENAILLAEDFPRAKRPAEKRPQGSTDLRRLLHTDQSAWLSDNLLERDERIAAAASLEVRLPFLDHRLAEYVSSLPDEERVHGLSTKWILRRAARRVLPPRLPQRRKLGWPGRVKEWMRGELRESLGDHLQGTNAMTRRYYRGETLDRAIDEHLNGKKDHGTLLWTLLNLEIWHRTYARG